MHSWPKLDQSDSSPGNLVLTQSQFNIKSYAKLIYSWVEPMSTRSHTQDKVMEDQRPSVSKESWLAKQKGSCLQNYVQEKNYAAAESKSNYGPWQLPRVQLHSQLYLIYARPPFPKNKPSSEWELIWVRFHPLQPLSFAFKKYLCLDDHSSMVLFWTVPTETILARLRYLVMSGLLLYCHCLLVTSHTPLKASLPF